MRLTKGFAEILGMFAADGCLQDKYICMWGNITEDKDYYDNIVCPLFSKIAKKQIKAHEKKSNSVYGFYLCDKKIVQLFRNLGFTKNKTYDVTTPKIILDSNSPEIYARFIRGFADCDGNINFMKRKGKYSFFKRNFNTYPRVEIKVVSKEIIREISSMLNKLNIKHTVYLNKSKKYNEKDQLKISIRGPKRIEDWMKKIGFNNPAQHTKYLVWKKFGFCPAKITLNQRKLILNNKIDPHSFYKEALPHGFEPWT